MLDREVKNVIFIGLSCIILAAVLQMVSMAFSIVTDFADVRNNEISNYKKLAMYREFNKYNETIVYGEDIIEAIRKYHNTDVEIYVDSVDGGGVDYYVTKDLAKLAGEEEVNGVMTNSLVGTPKLQQIFKYNYEYDAILVYDEKDPRTISGTSDVTNYSSEVTGIVFLYKRTIMP